MTTTADHAESIASTATLTDDQIKSYREDGYVLLKGLISPEVASTLRREVMGIMAVIGLGQTKLKQTGEYLPGSTLDSFVNSPEIQAIAGALMEGPATLYMPFTAVKSARGGGEFHFHQDNQYTRFDGPGINLWFALNPMTEANGCLKVVPRSHLHGTLPSAQSPDKDGHRTVLFPPEQFVSVIMAPGDCVAFTRLTVHGSGPNLSEEDRVAYALQFHRNDVSYSTDGGETYKLAVDFPRWQTGPVSHITVPTGPKDGH